jgi:hypothetical protein
MDSEQLPSLSQSQTDVNEDFSHHVNNKSKNSELWLKRERKKEREREKEKVKVKDITVLNELESFVNISVISTYNSCYKSTNKKSIWQIWE